MESMGKVKRVGHYVKITFSVLFAVTLLAGSGSDARENIKNIEASRVVIRSPELKVASLSKPLSAPALPSRQYESIRRVYTIEDGDSFFEVLKANGVPAEEALSVIKKTRRVFNTSKIKPGNAIQFMYSPDDQSVVEIDYEISDLRKLVVKISGERITARKVEMDKEEHFIPTTDSLPVPRERVHAQAKANDPASRPQVRDGGSKDAQEPVMSGLRQIDVKVKKGHSLFDILSEIGVSRIEIDVFTKSVKGVYNLSAIKTGKTLNIWLTQDRPVHIKRMTYEIDDTNYLDVSSVHGAFAARTRTLSRDVRLESAQGKISSSLYESAVSDGVNPEVVIRLADIFAHDINFFSGIHPGDTYAVLYEKYYVKDQFKGYGRVLAARFVNQGEEHTAIYYDNDRRGIHGYYDEKGQPMRKMFLKAPLNYRRISSFFSKHRMHPIFGVVRPHLGVDYAAPTGTPICSLGQGRVIFEGWVNGFGKTVRVNHPGGYVTYYGHLSRFAKGIRIGKAVDQGDTIGYVGSTGYATGPHLDFRVSCGKKYINPLHMKNVAGPPLRGSALADFKRLSSTRLAMMENRSRTIAMAPLSLKKDHEARLSPKG
jgi:murein DD-endopeptidase MepM/ murein hydrolase activator NlpD